MPVCEDCRSRGYAMKFVPVSYDLRLTLIYTEDDGSRFHRNVGTYLQNCTVSRSVRSHFLFRLSSDAATRSTQGSNWFHGARFPLEKLTVPQPVKKFPPCMGPEGLLPSSTQPATCSYSEAAISSPRPLYVRSTLILPTHPCPGLLMVSFVQTFHQNSHHCTWHILCM